MHWMNSVGTRIVCAGSAGGIGLICWPSCWVVFITSVWYYGYSSFDVKRCRYISSFCTRETGAAKFLHEARIGINIAHTRRVRVKFTCIKKLTSSFSLIQHGSSTYKSLNISPFGKFLVTNTRPHLIWKQFWGSIDRWVVRAFIYWRAKRFLTCHCGPSPRMICCLYSILSFSWKAGAEFIFSFKKKLLSG